MKSIPRGSSNGGGGGIRARNGGIKDRREITARVKNCAASCSPPPRAVERPIGIRDLSDLSNRHSRRIQRSLPRMMRRNRHHEQYRPITDRIKVQGLRDTPRPRATPLVGRKSHWRMIPAAPPLLANYHLLRQIAKLQQWAIVSIDRGALCFLRASDLSVPRATSARRLAARKRSGKARRKRAEEVLPLEFLSASICRWLTANAPITRVRRRALKHMSAFVCHRDSLRCWRSGSEHERVNGRLPPSSRHLRASGRILAPNKFRDSRLCD